MTIYASISTTDLCDYETAYQCIQDTLSSKMPVSGVAYDTNRKDTVGIDLDFKGSKWTDQTIPMLDVWGEIASALIFSGAAGVKFEVVK